MALLPKVKFRTLPTFPADIIGGTGIDATKQNGAVVVDLDFSEFGTISSIPTSPTSYILTYDTVADSYVMVPSHLLGGGVSGIADAPNDGTLYGRKNLAWIPVPVSATSVKDFGAKCDTRQIYATVTITAGSQSLAAIGAAFVPADVGKTIIIPGAGAGGAGHRAIITSIVDATHVTLSVAALATLTAIPNTFLTYGTDDTTAVQNIVNYFVATGGNIGLSGRILITAPIVIDCSADTMVWLTQGTSLNFSGGGSGNTTIIHSACFNGPALDFRGHLSAGSPSSKQNWQGFNLASAIYGTPNTTGIKAADMALSVFTDIMISGFANAITATDMLSSSFYFCMFGYNTQGFTASYSNLSRPNAISFFSCNFGSCSDWGISTTGGTALTIVGGTFENCGSTVSNIGAIYVVDPGAEGGVALSCTGVYFEGTIGLADIVIGKSTTDTSVVVVDGCDFHRSGSTASNYCIVGLQSTPTTGKIVLSCRSSFRHFAGYTPNLSRPAIRFIGDPACEYDVDTSGSYFGSPLYAWPETTPTAHAMVKFSGADGTVLNSRGVKSVVRTAAGKYTINLRNVMRGTHPVLIGTSSDGLTITDQGAPTTSSVTVWVFNATSIPSDPFFCSVAIYDAP